MKLRHILLLTIITILLTACNQTLAADVTPPPNYQPPTPIPALGQLHPEQAPNVENGKIIYAEKCAACHGDTGLGNGPQSQDLPVSVIPIGLPEFAVDVTPSDWYTTVTQGRIERFMPPFNSLTDQERWDVVAYALTLHTSNEQIELGKSLFEENCADCASAFTNQQMMSALSEDNLVTLIREGSANFPAFGSGFSDEEAYAVAAYLRTLTFAAPSAPVAVEATEDPAATEAVTPSAEETAVDGTPQAEVTPDPQATEAPIAGNLITGQIDNRTGEDLPANLQITLRGFDHGSDPSAGPTEILNTQGAVNADGSYTFEAELVESQIYLTEFEFNGMSYQSEFAVVPADANELVIETIVIYPTTEDLSVLKIEELQIFFDLAGEQAQVFAVYFVVNDSGKTVLIPMTDGQNIPFIAFPEGSTGLGFETTDSTAPFLPTDEGFAMPPSETPYGLIAFASLPKAKELQIIQPALLPINTISLFLPEGVEAEGSSLTDTGIQNLQGANFHVYTAAAVTQDGTLEFTLTGQPETTAGTTDITQNQTVLIGVGALGLTLILAGVFMYLRDRKKEDDTEDTDDDEDNDDEDDTLEDTESIMDAIIALDDLHRSGKINDEAYKKRRAELTNALRNMVAMIEVKKLIKRFGLKTILKGLDFTVQPGEFVALLGPNGAGKTTFLRILASLSRPSLGSVKVAGYSLPNESAKVRARLGVVSHMPLLYPDLTAEENLQFYGRMYGLSPLEKRITEVLGMVGLEGRRRDLVRTFSRGMQQRLAIGRAIIHDPEVVLFDEPYTGLDQDASEMLDKVLRSVAAKGRTVVMTSHDLARAEDLATRFDVLTRGVIVSSGTREDFKNSNLLDFYKKALEA